MSQAGKLFDGTILPDIETLTGNSGGAVGPTGGNINVLGDTTTIDIVGNPGTSTLTVSLTGGTDGQVPIAATAGSPTWASVSAGQNITITPGANTLSIAASQAQILTAYRVANASPFVVNATDFYITVDTTTIPITIQLPDAPTTYRRFIIKDSGGMAATNNVTVTTVSGVLNIDAAPTFVMNSNYQAIELMYSGFGYEVF